MGSFLALMGICAIVPIFLAFDESPEVDGADSSDGDRLESTPESGDGPNDSEQAQYGSVEHFLFGGSSDDRLVGSSSGELIAGGAGDDRMQGMGGDDTIAAMESGADVSFGGRGDDQLVGFQEIDLGGGEYLLDEDHQTDSLYGGSGDDIILAGAGDVITGGSGTDQLVANWATVYADPVEVLDFDPKKDQLFVHLSDFDDQLNECPFEVESALVTSSLDSDGEGTTVFLDGKAIFHLVGVTEFDAGSVLVNVSNA